MVSISTVSLHLYYKLSVSASLPVNGGVRWTQDSIQTVPSKKGVSVSPGVFITVDICLADGTLISVCISYRAAFGMKFKARLSFFSFWGKKWTGVGADLRQGQVFSAQERKQHREPRGSTWTLSRLCPQTVRDNRNTLNPLGGVQVGGGPLTYVSAR